MKSNLEYHINNQYMFNVKYQSEVYHGQGLLYCKNFNHLNNIKELSNTIIDFRRPCDMFQHITQLFGCVPWDHVSHEHNFPFTVGFLVDWEHSKCVLQTF